MALVTEKLICCLVLYNTQTMLESAQSFQHIEVQEETRNKQVSDTLLALTGQVNYTQAHTDCSFRVCASL